MLELDTKDESRELSCVHLRLQSQHKSLVQYLRSKVDSADWHGVADAAMDLREVEAKLSILKETK